MSEFSRRSKRYKAASLRAFKALCGVNNANDDKSIGSINKMPCRRLKSLKPRKHLEDELQVKLVSWIKSCNWPVFGIFNQGKRSIGLTEKYKRMGLWPGATDLLIPYPSGKFAAFFIELKTPGEKPRKNQLEFMQAMRMAGNKAEWYDDFDQAKEAIIKYFGM